MIGKATPGGSGFGGGVGRQGRHRRQRRWRPGGTTSPGSSGARSRAQEPIRGVAAADAAVEQVIVERARTQFGDGKREGAGRRARRVKHLHHQDAVADGLRARAAGVQNGNLCRASGADGRAVDDQCIGERCGAALVEHGVEHQRAAIGDERAAAAGSRRGPAAPASDHHYVARHGVALQIDHARIGERRHADHLALQRPAERHCVVGVPEREILPRAVQRRGACHCGERSAFRCW